ncbi:hypothetical protein [Verrucomicrobium spinosum]|uniref:hypothetical protein n=1 Tax=Verrucomicrobium spinosum TaxID=2736 RepID=UPI00017453D5|nr:hypothetical protein [Verrucomicrobium spinosum]
MVLPLETFGEGQIDVFIHPASGARTGVDARLVWIIGFVIAMGWLWIAILKGSMYLVED